jgi:hypothetical protein
LVLSFLLGTTCFAQKRGSQEMGMSVSFWSIASGDSSVSNMNLTGVFATYLTRDFLFEFEPIVSAQFKPEKVELTGLLMAGVSKRIIDVSNIDNASSNSQWARKHERTTAGIYGSVSGGIWAERMDPPMFDEEEGWIRDTKIYAAPALGVALGTHSSLGSLTNVRTKFQLVYLMPRPPLYKEPRTMFTITVGFGVITRL